MRRLVPLLPCVVLGICAGAFPASAVEFERIVIDSNFPGGYQVEVADVNGDKKPDVVAIGGGTCAWYENPRWTKRIVTTPKQTPGIISSATADLDGDGKAEIAIAYEFSMNEPKKGDLLLAVQGKEPDASWSTVSITGGDLCFVGSSHRLRWGDVDGDKRLDLIDAPIFGPGAHAPAFDQSPARLLVFHPRDRIRDGGWEVSVQGADNGRPVLHAIEVKDVDGEGVPEILTADNRGVALFAWRKDGLGLGEGRSLIPGAPGEAPKRGSSEVHLGRLRDGRRFLATIDPWHGSQVAVCLEKESGSLTFEPRTVIDDTLADGHALWVADVDGDGTDEIFAGHRGADHRVSFYQFDSKTWARTVLDKAIAAQDLRGGDLDGDGTPDVVAIGGQTHNVVWYRPVKSK